MFGWLKSVFRRRRLKRRVADELGSAMADFRVGMEPFNPSPPGAESPRAKRIRLKREARELHEKIRRAALRAAEVKRRVAPEKVDPGPMVQALPPVGIRKKDWKKRGGSDEGLD